MLPTLFYNKSAMKRFLILFLFVILIVTGGAIRYFGKPRELSVNQVAPQPKHMETVTMTTEDGVEVVGDYYLAGTKNVSAVLLLHMMPATRKSWVEFAEKLNDAGFSALAIDLRGHGDSLNKSDGTYLNYKNFSNAEHQSSIHDVEASANFLKQKGATKIIVIGASIGANLALQYAAAHHDIRSAVLLSPGLDYRGVLTDHLPEQFQRGQAVYYVVSSEDSYAAESARTLYQETSEEIKKEEKIFDQAGHGTDMFSHEPGFEDQIIAWLKTSS